MAIKVLLDTSPLNNAHAIRGVGNYTRFLSEELAKIPQLELLRASQQPAQFRPDIIHYPFFDLFFATLPWWKRAKTVLTIHDVIPLIFPHFYPVGYRGRLAFWHQRIALQSVDCIITDSLASQADIHHYFHVPLQKIRVIPLAGNPQLQPVSEKILQQVRHRLHLPKTYVVYVGDINYNKNIPQLIKTLKYLPREIHLVCVGKNFAPQDIPEWQWIESQLALSNVQQRVHFFTDILGDDFETISALYQAALAYIQPSLYEGFGLPILEAMQCRTPVICAQNSSLPEVAGKNAFLVEHADAQEFAQAVLQIQAWSKTARETWVKKAQQWAGHFSWAHTAQQTFAVYQELLNEKSAQLKKDK